MFAKNISATILLGFLCCIPGFPQCATNAGAQTLVLIIQAAGFIEL